VTPAFAALNLVTYAVWWYKPLNVGCHVRVYRQGKKEKGDDKVTSPGTGGRDAEAGENQVAEEAGTPKKRRASESVWGLVATHINTGTTAIVIVSEMLASIGKAMAEIGRTLQNYVREYRCHSVWHTLEAVLFPVCGLLYGLWYVI
jgi:hypothetical protein